MGPAEAIRDLIEPPLAAAGLELWDVEVTPSAVRVLVDRDGGVDLDALSEASAVVSPVLDEHEDVAPAGHYELEVSSPGVERTLRTVEQYRRYLGTLVSVKTSAPVAGSRRLRGTLVDVDESAIRLRPEDAPADAEPVAIDHSLISRTRTVLVWGPAPKPGRRGSAPTPSAKDASS